MKDIIGADKLLYEVAVARCITEGKKQAEIGELLKLSQASVSRLSTNNPHITKPRLEPVLPRSVKKADILRQVTTLLNKRDARAYLEGLSPYRNLKVDIVHGQPPPKNVAAVGFDPRFATLLSRLIKRSQLVGVAWELGIKPYADDIPGFVQRDYALKENPVRFIPLCGITADSDEALVKSSTAIAMRYHRLVNKNFPIHEPKLLNLNCIPLVHPEVKIAPSSQPKADPWAPNSKEVIEYLRAAFPDYEQIFGKMTDRSGSTDALADNVDMIITGTGASANDTNNLLNKLYPGVDKIRIHSGPKQNRYLSKTQIREEVIVGDIAGVLLANLNSESAAFNETVVTYLNDRLATLRPMHLRGCCEHADSDLTNRVPGVVVLASGAYSTDCLIAAVKQGYVSRVIIDDDLARGIEAKITQTTTLPGTT